MSNPYFKHAYDPNNNEAELYRKMTHEIIEMKGIDMYYIPRTVVDIDNIFGEDARSKFSSNKLLTFLVVNAENYDGLGDIFSKFGFTPDNQITLSIEQEHCKSIIGKVPIEGDLIYYPHDNKILEIVHVEDDDGFHQLNHQEWTYRIKCKLFEYSYETLETNVSEVDTINQIDQTTSDEKTQIDSEIDNVLNLDESDLFGNL